MSIENNNQQEQKNIVKPNETKTIESVLQEKFNDPTKESFFSEIFNDTNIKNIYKQESIVKFIQWQKNINKFYRENQETEHQEKVKMISEEIDIFEQNNGNTTIINVSILEDKVVQKEDKVVQKEDKVVQKEDKVVQKEDKVVQKEDKVENQKTLLEARTATNESYNKLDQKYKQPTTQEDQQQINTIKNSFTKETETILTTQNLDIDTYAKFIFTQQKYGEELKNKGNTGFLDNLEKLNTLLWVVPENIRSKKLFTNPDQAHAIVDSNPSLKNYTDKSPTLNTITIPGLPNFDTIEEEFDFYSKFITDTKTQKNLEDNEKIIKKYNPEKADETSKKIYQDYQKTIQEIQEQLPEKTKTISKQRILASCITGLSKYFDSTTLNQKNLADEFDINTQKKQNIWLYCNISYKKRALYSFIYKSWSTNQNN